MDLGLTQHRDLRIAVGAQVGRIKKIDKPRNLIEIPALTGNPKKVSPQPGAVFEQPGKILARLLDQLRRSLPVTSSQPEPRKHKPDHGGALLREHEPLELDSLRFGSSEAQQNIRLDQLQINQLFLDLQGLVKHLEKLPCSTQLVERPGPVEGVLGQAVSTSG